MREKESKIRFTKEDPARDAASSEGTHIRPKPRPPSGDKLRLTGQEARETAVSEAMHSETAYQSETTVENTAGVREGFSPESENQGASPEAEIYDTGHTKQEGTDIRSVETNAPRKTGAGKLRYRSAGAEKFEQSAGHTTEVPDRTAETIEGRNAEKTAAKTASVRDAAKAKAQKSFGSKLRTVNSASKAQSGKLRFESTDADPVTLKKPVRHVRPIRAAGTVLSGQVHAKTAEYENNNVGVEALNETEGMAEAGVRKVASGRYGRKLHQAGKAAKKSKEAGEKVIAVAKEHPMAILLGGVLAIVILVFGGVGGYFYLKTKRSQTGSSRPDPDAGYRDDDDDLDIYEIPEEPDQKEAPISEDDPDYWLDDDDE